MYACRDINEGEELLLSFGDVSPTGYIFKYGDLPSDFLNHFNILSDVSLWTPPQLIPTEEMRVRCLEKSNYPLKLLKECKGGTALVNLFHREQGLEDIEAYKRFDKEPDVIKSMRQYLIVAVLADDFELNRNYDMGRLRGPMYESRVLPVMCDVVDYTILICSMADHLLPAHKMQRGRRVQTCQGGSKTACWPE